MPHLVGVARGEPPGLMIGAFMRVLGHPTDRRAGAAAQATASPQKFNIGSRSWSRHQFGCQQPNIEANRPPDGELGVKPMYVDAVLSQLALTLLALFVLIQLVIAALNRISKRAIFQLPVDVGRAFQSLVADAHGSSWG